MAHEVLMPKLSSTMTEGTLTTWLKNEGDSVALGEAIFEVMTDKIAIEVEAYEAGILLKKVILEGEKAPVNSVVGYLGEEGESLPPTPHEAASAITSTRLVMSEGKSGEAVKSELTTQLSAGTLSGIASQIPATPAARKLARENGVDLTEIQGSGPRGRIQAQDVLSASVLQGTPEMKKNTASPVVPWSGMRQAIADKMMISQTTIPAVTMAATVDMRQMIAVRKVVKPLVEEQVNEHLSYTELILKAVTVALQQYPQLNAHATAAGIQEFQDINLGVAVSLSEGLVVPVIHQAETLGLSRLTQQVKRLAREARSGTLKSESLAGGTFTVSSLGKSRVTHFTPIINAPEVAILGVGGMSEVAKLHFEGGENRLQSVPMLPLSLTFDHRVIDGAVAAAFLSLVVALLEEPTKLLL